MYKNNLVNCMLLISIGLLTGKTNAQMPMEIFQNPKNLKVLPSDISPEELRETMFSFGQQTGIRCSKCHNFEPGTPFEERDYASDEKELKRVAREMMRMVNTINEAVSAIDRDPGHNALKVQCVTCHRGVRQPRQIEEIFESKMQESGLTEAIDQYKKLRERYLVNGVYNFTAWRLGGIAQSVFDSGDTDGGMQVHALNYELNPDDGSVYFHRGESFEKQGRINEAIADFERAFELEKSFRFLEHRIAQLKGEQEGK